MFNQASLIGEIKVTISSSGSIDEIVTLISPIKDAWLNIPQSEKDKAEELRKNAQGA